MINVLVYIICIAGGASLGFLLSRASGKGRICGELINAAGCILTGISLLFLDMFAEISELSRPTELVGYLLILVSFLVSGYLGKKHF